MMKQFFKRHFHFLIMLRAYFRYVYNTHIRVTKQSAYGYMSSNTIIEPPILWTNQSLVYLDTCKIRRGMVLINNTGKFVVKKYSAIALNCTVVTGNHKPTVGVPHLILGSGHINDSESDIIIEEEVWIGMNCTLLCGAHIGRGAIIGACSMVNKEIPPYAVAVGSPARIIASVFTIDEIIKHEERIYPEKERFSRVFLEELFATNFQGKKSIGLDNLNDELEEVIRTKKAQFGLDY